MRFPAVIQEQVPSEVAVDPRAFELLCAGHVETEWNGAFQLAPGAPTSREPRGLATRVP